MNILDKIIADKFKEVELKKSLIPVSQLENSVLFDRKCISLAESLKNGSGIIAEHKRRSPSKSVINQSLNVQDVVKGYEEAEVSGISVLTDGKYFGGSLEDLLYARASVNTPLLRKEFMVDAYQVSEAKAYGADAILLIAAVLSEKQLIYLADSAKKLGMDVLLEIHNEEELQKSLNVNADMIGVNNRNLKTFEVSIDTSKRLAKLIPNEFVKVSESGISTTAAITDLKNYGFEGFLIGENFMKTDNPGAAAKEFITELKSMA
ncbi:indole-3-glycerol phosphate synthase TrpC [Christiangramia forsetii]|uniref:Indole-3-glycerol phosphate synthase n=2 Tax=Christiangramia forsetii TaxID=411153 RepID=A0M4T2_CHRFK|nr:indole-3-glycerol phosphate synthase TrpC [Christiangramia forsetii]GGG22714.1 indole-3-glycerol phosphate synthase [Christiangramia forsetii]CAL67627.1 indole-3-glycerol phosphate synthase [Christiangramia forsetii KT0803]